MAITRLDQVRHALRTLRHHGIKGDPPSWQVSEVVKADEFIEAFLNDVEPMLTHIRSLSLVWDDGVKELLTPIFDGEK